MNLNSAVPGDVVIDDASLPSGQYAQAFIVATVGGNLLSARSTKDGEVHEFNLGDGTSLSLPGLAVHVERRVSEWIDDDYCALRCIAGTDPSRVATRVAFIEKTPRVRTAPFTFNLDDYNGWQQGPKGCAPEYGRYEPSRDWCNRKLLDLGYELPEGAPEGYERPAQVPVSQLQTYLAANDGLLKVDGKAYRIDNVRHEADLGFFADVHSQRAKYLGMSVSSTIKSKPGAEVWEILRLTGKGTVVASFAIHEGAVFPLAR